MGISRLVASTLTIECPRCGGKEEDDFEVIPDDGVQVMRCSQCSTTYRFLIAECDKCGAEGFFAWASFSRQGCPSDFNCPACGQACLGHDPEELTIAAHR